MLQICDGLAYNESGSQPGVHMNPLVVHGRITKGVRPRSFENSGITVTAFGRPDTQGVHFRQCGIIS